MKTSFKSKIVLILIFLFALALRLYGLNWDSFYHLHPDERFLTMVANDIQLPASLSQYFSTSTSPLNPYNYPQYQFFVYGTFPLFLTKLLAVLFHADNYQQLTLLGRFLSALFDSLNVISLYFIAKKSLKSYYRFLPPLFYSLLVLPLQLSHFFAVDTFLNFFLLLTFALLLNNLFIPAFLVFGLALACKISALYFIPIILLILIYQQKKFSLILKSCLYFFFSLLSFRLFQPYAFNGFRPNPLFISNLKTLSLFASPDSFYPPSVQWLNRPLLLDSFQNLFFWGLGLAFSLPLIFFALRFCFRLKFKFNLNFIILAWVVLLFFYQALQFTHTMRYFLPLYPFLCLLLATLLAHFHQSLKVILPLLFLNLLYSLAFLSIYSRPNSRVQATTWINQHLTSTSVLSSEYWDDALPLGYSSFNSLSLSFYDPESTEKWQKINSSLDQIDYQILSSNRLWGSIPRVPKLYPETSNYYRRLFNNETSFRPLISFRSYPGFSLPFLSTCYYFGPSVYPSDSNSWFSTDSQCLYPGIYLRDDSAEEAFTVYDHPQVLIFAKEKSN